MSRRGGYSLAKRNPHSLADLIVLLGLVGGGWYAYAMGAQGKLPAPLQRAVHELVPSWPNAPSGEQPPDDPIDLAVFNLGYFELSYDAATRTVALGAQGQYRGPGGTYRLQAWLEQPNWLAGWQLPSTACFLADRTLPLEPSRDSWWFISATMTTEGAAPKCNLWAGGTYDLRLQVSEYGGRVLASGLIKNVLTI